MIRLAVFPAAFALVASASAHADPCTAIPEEGPLPAGLTPGSTFSGRVVHVIDGDSLCVATGADPRAWVEVRMAGFYAPELKDSGGDRARAALERLALGKDASCVARRQSYDRVVASCLIGGRSVDDLMRSAGVAQGGRGYAPVAEAREAPLPIVAHADARPAAPLRRSAGGGVFRNCAEARAAGAAPLRRGEPGYGAHMDGDGDGVACEPYRRRR